MLLGDSWAEEAGSYMSSFCKGASFVNMGIGGTTAEQWGAAGGGTPCTKDGAEAACCMDGWSPDLGDHARTCKASDAFAYGSGFTHVWVSVGMNDFHYSDCNPNLNRIKADVLRTINNVRAAAPAAVQIVLTGYCQPLRSICQENESNGPESFASFQAAIGAAVAEAGEGVTFVDSLGACGGSATAWSSKTYLKDAYHLNRNGYCATWTMPEVQLALGCQRATYDCGDGAAASPPSPSPPSVLLPPPSPSPPPPTPPPPSPFVSGVPPAVRISGLSGKYGRRTEGVYVLHPRTYRGRPRYQRHDNKGRRWSLYVRRNGMWVLDFNKVSQSWSGTVAYSEEQPGRTVLTADWIDFEGLSVQAVEQHEAEALVHKMADAGKVETEGGDDDDDDEATLDDSDEAEHGELVTVAMPASVSTLDDSDEAEHGELVTVAMPASVSNAGNTLAHPATKGSGTGESAIPLFAIIVLVVLAVAIAAVMITLYVCFCRNSKILAVGHADKTASIAGAGRTRGVAMVVVDGDNGEPPLPQV